jgi:hypothetical protein
MPFVGTGTGLIPEVIYKTAIYLSYRHACSYITDIIGHIVDTLDTYLVRLCIYPDSNCFIYLHGIQCVWPGLSFPIFFK